MYSNNIWGGKYWTIVGPKLPGTPGDPNYRVPDYSVSTVSGTEYQPSNPNSRHIMKCVLYEDTTTTTATTRILTNSDITLQARSQNCGKATISFVVSVCLSVSSFARPHGTTRLPLDGFSWNLIFEDFSNIRLENSSFIDINGYFTWTPTYIYDHISLTS